MRRLITFLLLLFCGLCLLQAQKKPTIDTSRFSISATSASFTADGGSNSFEVTADKGWSIKTNPASWATLTTKGKVLNLKVEANLSSVQRETFFVITSIGKTITVKVTQSAKSITIFKIDKENANFGSSGGSMNFTVSCSGSWHIEENTIESWGHLEQYGNTLTLRIYQNNKSYYRTGYFKIKSGARSICVNVYQDAGASHKFEISPANVSFDAHGGSKTFTVSCDGLWGIDVSPASWGHLVRNNNTLTLKVDSNPATTARNDFFKIKSGAKTLRVNIFQEPQPIFEISETSVVFESSGGTKIFTVTSTYSWKILNDTYSWGHLTKDENKLILTVDENMRAKDRDDYFVISSGEKQIRVNILQKGLR
jgi:hypothetical protein